MWKGIIKKEDICVRCKKKPATYREYDEMANNMARQMDYEPENLCEDWKDELLDIAADARAFD